MTEEQIQWLKENLSIQFKPHGWSGGLSVQLFLNDEEIRSDWIGPNDLADAAGLGNS